MPERVLELSYARVKWFLVMANDDGIIFGAEVGPRQVMRYQKK